MGAGDAFCAGMLYGIHDQWLPENCLQLGSCCAAACLSAEDANSGLKPLNEVLNLTDQFKYRSPPISIT